MFRLRRCNGQEQSFGRPGREFEADLRLVLALDTVGRVMHLEHDVRSGGNESRRPIDVKPLGLHPRDVPHEKLTCEYRHITANVSQHVSLPGGPWRPRFSAKLRLHHPLRSPGSHHGDHVMDTRTVGRPNLPRSNPGVLLERRCDSDIGVLNRCLGWDLQRLGQLEHKIRPDVPAVTEHDGRRFVPLVALGRTTIHPRSDGGNLLIGQTLVVGEMSIPRIREPRRHRLGDDGRFDRAGPWPHTLVGSGAASARSLLVDGRLDTSVARSAAHPC
jgi:hypothetical protein